MSIKENIERILERIEKAKEKAGRKDFVYLLGATKGVLPEKIIEAYDSGLKLFGENRIQEAIPKIEKLKNLDIEWHFIGHLQKNKAKEAIENFSLIQSVDSLSLAKRLQQIAQIEEKIIPFLIEINIGDEPTKYGVKVEELPQFIEEIQNFDNLKFKGIMAIPPYNPDPEKVRPYFKEMYKIYEKLSSIFSSVEYLSIGMSEDFEVAIEEGSNMVRIGRAIFGERL
ncbi:MAG: YggS family pyridoxal phosphate-dependent enzyme [Thermoanaerobaculia bacterium]